MVDRIRPDIWAEFVYYGTRMGHPRRQRRHNISLLAARERSVAKSLAQARAVNRATLRSRAPGSAGVRVGTTTCGIRTAADAWANCPSSFTDLAPRRHDHGSLKIS